MKLILTEKPQEEKIGNVKEGGGGREEPIGRGRGRHREIERGGREKVGLAPRS